MSTEKKQNFPAKTQVQQGNDIVKSFYKMDAEQTNIFYFALSKIEQAFNPIKYLQNPDSTIVDFNDFKAQFSLSEMFKALDLPDTKNMRDVYFSKFVDLLDVKIKVDTIDEKKFYPLYSEAAIGTKSKKKYDSEICIIFNPLLFKKIFASQYTNGQLKVLGQLSKGTRNNYAQRLYFYLAMFRNTQGKKQYHNEHKGEWKVKMTESYFRELVQMPKDEKSRKDNFRRTIKNTVKKINEKNFEFVTTLDFGDYKSDEMTFICNENMNLYKLSKDDSPSERAEKLEVNKSDEEAAYFRQKYADEWNEILFEEMKKGILVGGEDFKKSVAEANTLQRMRELHKDDKPENSSQINQ